MTTMNKKLKIALVFLGISAAVTTGVVILKRKKTVTSVTAPNGSTVSLNSIQSAIISEASRWVGVKEIGNNASFSNSDFEAKMKDKGYWKTGEPYCAAFVMMVLVSVSSGAAQAVFKQYGHKNAEYLYNSLKNTAYSEVIKTPEPGCIVCYKGHTELCESTDGKTNTVITANSLNADGSQGVSRKTRKAGAALGTDPFLGYIRIKKLS